MKISTKITAVLFALGIVSQASAVDPTVYLTGSSAFRSTVEAALVDNTGGAGAVFQAGSITYGTWGNSSPGSASYMVFHGKEKTTGNPVYVNCAWSGSEAGIASACNTTLGNKDRNGNPINLSGSPETWVDDSTATLAAAPAGNVQAGNPGPNGALANGAQLEAASHGADLAQADTSQAISWTPAVANTVTALKDYGSEGVVTFTWTRNAQALATSQWTNCNNLTIPQITVLLANGAVPAGFISGNAADDNFEVYLVGRNLGSGTRMNALADCTYGPHNAVKQYSIGGGVEATETWANVLNLQPEANGGYESGGGVAKAMGILGSCQQADPFNGGTGWFALAYLSPSDALNTGNNGGEPIADWVTVDGVLESNGAIENGSFWFWGHEHLYGKYLISGIQNTVGTTLLSAVEGSMVNLGYGTVAANHDAGISYTLMNVSKGSDVSFPSF
jgi:hypothetical protein